MNEFWKRVGNVLKPKSADFTFAAALAGDTLPEFDAAKHPKGSLFLLQAGTTKKLYASSGAAWDEGYNYVLPPSGDVLPVFDANVHVKGFEFSIIPKVVVNQAARLVAGVVAPNGYVYQTDADKTYQLINGDGSQVADWLDCGSGFLQLKYESSGSAWVLPNPFPASDFGTTNKDIRVETIHANKYIYLDYFSDVDHAVINVLRSRGTRANPTYCLDGDELGGLAFREGVSGQLLGGSGINALATENHSITNQGSTLRIFTTQNGTVNKVVRVAIRDWGDTIFYNRVGIGTGEATPGAPLHIAQQFTAGLILERTSTPSKWYFVVGLNSGSLAIKDIGTPNIVRWEMTSGGLLGLGVAFASISAVLHLRAGTAAAKTSPLKFTAGVLNTTPELGAVEFIDDGTNGAFYITLNVGGVLTRKQIAFV